MNKSQIDYRQIIEESEEYFNKNDVYDVTNAIKRLKNHANIYHKIEVDPLLEKGDILEYSIRNFVLKTTANLKSFDHNPDVQIINQKCAEIEKEYKILIEELKIVGLSNQVRKQKRKRLSLLQIQLNKFITQISEWEKENENEINRIDSLKNILEPQYKKLKQLQKFGQIFSIKLLLFEFIFSLIKYIAFIALFIVELIIDLSANSSEENLKVFGIKDLHFAVLFIVFLIQYFLLENRIEKLKTKLFWLEFKLILKNFKETFNATEQFKYELDKIDIPN